VLVDLSFVTAEEGWVLGTAPCKSAPCTSVLHTTDGGRSWAGIPAPQAFLINSPKAGGPDGDCSTAACVSHLRFGTPRVAYAYGPDLFVTQDAGATWARQDDGVAVMALELRGTEAVRVIGDRREYECSGGCRLQQRQGTTGSWRDLSVPRVHGTTVRLEREGAHIYVGGYANIAGGAGPKYAEFYRSTDGGATWKRFDDPCARHKAYATDLAAAPGGVVSVLCLDQSTARGTASVVLSSDAAATFGPPRRVPPLKFAGDNFADDIDMGSAEVLSAVGGRQAETTTNGGRSWDISLATESGWVDSGDSLTALGYQNGQTARVIGPATTVWTTRDGGRHWEPHRFE
jgi:hypothetical protein